jgi:hypothetical protein
MVHSSAARAGRVLAALASTVLLMACGDFGGESQGETAAPQQLASQVGGANSVAAFEATVYPLTTQYCVGSGCHATRSPQIGHPDVATAHNEVVSQNKVNLGDPPSSRLVTRLTVNAHHCWNDCAADGLVMAAAIQQWADDIDFGAGGVDVGDTLASNSLTMAGGIEDPGSERYTTNQIALWEFKEGSGPTAADTSGVAPAMDLTLEGADVTWMTSYGIDIQDGMASAAADTSRKLYEQIADSATGTQQYSVEMWIASSRVDLMGPARIATYSINENSRNFMLGQTNYQFAFRNRSAPTTSNNGTPELITYDMDEDLQDHLQYVVITYDQYRGRRVYVDGVFTDDEDPRDPSPLWNWDARHRFALGDELNGGRQWQGQVRMVAIHRQALSQAQIDQNMAAGVGKRLIMRFDVSTWIGAASSVEFLVSELDAASYLFCAPTFRTTSTAGFRVANIRIAVNGSIPTSGQAFQTLDTQVVGGGVQELTSRCSVIPKPAGSSPDDVFTIVFEHLNGFQNVEVVNAPPPAGVILFPAAVPTTGLRDFARINETMAELTGVDPLLPDVRATYLELQQQLPGSPDLRSFVSSQQVGIAKLALEYCDALVEDPALRDDVFGTAFDFTVEPLVAFATPTERNLIYDGLYDRMIGTALALQPDLADVRSHLDDMVNVLLAPCGLTPCDAERTESMVKGACAAVLSSAAVSVH